MPTNKREKGTQEHKQFNPQNRVPSTRKANSNTSIKSTRAYSRLAHDGGGNEAHTRCSASLPSSDRVTRSRPSCSRNSRDSLRLKYFSIFASHRVSCGLRECAGKHMPQMRQLCSARVVPSISTYAFQRSRGRSARGAPRLTKVVLFNGKSARARAGRAQIAARRRRRASSRPQTNSNLFNPPTTSSFYELSYLLPLRMDSYVLDDTNNN